MRFKIFLRYFLWALVFVSCSAGIYRYIKLSSSPSTSSAQVIHIGTADQQQAVQIGGNFNLKDTEGRQRTHKSWPGKYLLVYFGYSYCPDICPAALDHMTQALNQLGQKGKKIQALFITIDPSRDSASQLKKYMENFHPSILALTGAEEDLSPAIKGYRVVARKVTDSGDPLDPKDMRDDYLVDHSSIIYLMNPEGKFVAHYNHLTPGKELAQSLAGHVK